MFWWGFLTSGLALSLNEQHVCTVWNKGPVSKSPSWKCALHTTLLAAVLHGWTKPLSTAQLCNANSSDRRVFWELVNAYVVFGLYYCNRHSWPEKTLYFHLFCVSCCMHWKASRQRCKQTLLFFRWRILVMWCITSSIDHFRWMKVGTYKSAGKSIFVLFKAPGQHL